mgnify:CR=1 FL=1
MLEEGLSPRQISPVKVIKAFSQVVELISKAANPISLLKDELADAILADESQRTSSKKSRNYPRKKKHRRCGVPSIESATPEQRRRYKQLNV